MRKVWAQRSVDIYGMANGFFTGSDSIWGNFFMYYRGQSIYCILRVNTIARNFYQSETPEDSVLTLVFIMKIILRGETCRNFFFDFGFEYWCKKMFWFWVKVLVFIFWLRFRFRLDHSVFNQSLNFERSKKRNKYYRDVFFYTFFRISLWIFFKKQNLVQVPLHYVNLGVIFVYNCMYIVSTY